MTKGWILVLIFWYVGLSSLGSSTRPYLLRDKEKYRAASLWADSLMQDLSPEAKVAQLLMPIVNAGDGAWEKKIEELVQQTGVGGLLFDKGQLEKQVLATNRAQSLAEVPLLISMDAEWGLAMRLEGTPSFPKNTMLGALRDTFVLYDYGLEMARQCRLIGAHINFAPVVDINTNPANPVINTRSFGSDPQRVAAYAAAYAKGLERGGVMAVMKHFPGHGDTSEDSHLELAGLQRSRAGLDSFELVPFKHLIRQGVSGVMTGHLSVPALETDVRLPASQSAAVIEGLLKKELGFDGLCITDALGMKGASTQSGDICVRALQAGNDILLAPPNPAADVKAILSAIEQGSLSQQEIDEKCRKVLIYKYILGLNKYKPADTSSLQKRLNTAEVQRLSRYMYANSITLLRNRQDLLPFRHLERKSLAVVSLERPAETPFVKMLRNYSSLETFSLMPGNELDKRDLKQTFGQYDKIIVCVYSGNTNQIEWLSRFNGLNNLCVCYFISPYRMQVFDRALSEPDAVLCAYEESLPAQEAAAQAVFGGTALRGVLPAPIGTVYPAGHGLQTEKTRLSYGIPEESGMSAPVMSKIDSIVEDALNQGAMPGCQVVVAKNGRVVWNRAYGWIDSERSRPTNTDDVYDLASLTKALVCTPAIMSLYEQGKIKLDEPLSNHLPVLRDTDKEHLTYRNVLYHQARLSPFVPFYQYLLDTTSYPGPFLSTKPDSLHPMRFDEFCWIPLNFSFRSELVSGEYKGPYSLQAAENFYVNASFRDSVCKIIAETSLLNNTRYTYSDLGFILMGFSAETLLGKTLDEWVENELFAPLGAETTMYQPLKKIAPGRIAPTTLDTCLRKQLLRGYVHDEAAAFLGGVAGNAGLFSSASDLVKVLQLFLDEGTYGSVRFFEPSTLRYFTSKRSSLSRRLLGFDGAETNKNKIQQVAPSASRKTYGHIGFTGTCFWVDPVHELIYIFLSNRVHPDRNNNLLSKLDVRPKIQEVLYESMEAYNKKQTSLQNGL